MKNRLYFLLIVIVFSMQNIVFAEELSQDWIIDYVGAEKAETRFAQIGDEKVSEGEQSLRIVYNTKKKVDGEYLEIRNNLKEKMTSGSYTLSFMGLGSLSKYTEISVSDILVMSHKDDMNAETMNNGWTKFSVTFDYEEQENGFIALRFYRSITELFIDDVVLTKSGSEDNIIINSGFEESVNAPQEEIPYDTTNYRPKNILCSPGAKMLVLNWVNPNTSDLTDIKLYDITDGEMLISDEISITPGAKVNYPIKDLADEERLYKIVFSFNSKSDFVFYTGGKPASGLDSYIDTWKIRRIRNTDDSWCPAEVVVDDTVSHSGNSSLKIVSNIDSSIPNLAKSTYVGIQFEVSMKAGKKYRVKLSGKSENASNQLLAVTLQGSSWKSRYTTDIFKGTTDWNDYYFDHESIGEDGIFLVYEGSCEGFWLDDFEIYEIDETGTLIGEGIIMNGDMENLIKSDETMPVLKAEAGIGEINLTWSKLPSDCNNVHIYKKLFDNWEMIGDIPKNYGSLKLDGLEKGKEYSFMLKPEFNFGNEGNGAQTSVTTILPEYEIYETTLTKDGVSIDKADGAGSYVVTTKIKNNLIEDGLSLEHFVAVYNEKHELVLFKSNAQQVKATAPASKPLTVSESFTLEPGEYTIEVFVLDSRKDLNILRDCQVF